LGQKNLFGSGQKVPGSKAGWLLIYSGSKVCLGRVGSGPISNSIPKSVPLPSTSDGSGSKIFDPGQFGPMFYCSGRVRSAIFGLGLENFHTINNKVCLSLCAKNIKKRLFWFFSVIQPTFHDTLLLLFLKLVCKDSPISDLSNLENVLSKWENYKFLVSLAVRGTRKMQPRKCHFLPTWSYCHANLNWSTHESLFEYHIAMPPELLNQIDLFKYIHT